MCACSLHVVVVMMMCVVLTFSLLRPMRDLTQTCLTVGIGSSTLKPPVGGTQSAPERGFFFTVPGASFVPNRRLVCAENSKCAAEILFRPKRAASTQAGDRAACRRPTRGLRFARVWTGWCEVERCTCFVSKCVHCLWDLRGYDAAALAGLEGMALFDALRRMLKTARTRCGV